jgi:hypothetical protein
MSTGGAAPEPSELAPILGRKVWARRDALPAVTRKLLVKVVEQTEARLQASVSERNTKRSWTFLNWASWTEGNRAHR